MRINNLVLNSKDYRTKTVLEQFTEKQQGLIKALKLIPLWESQTWLSWKEKYNSNIEDFNKHFLEYLDKQDLEENDDIKILITKRDNIFERRLKFVFISKKLDEKLSKTINKNYKYKNDLRNDLHDKEHSEILNKYIKMFKLVKVQDLKLNNEEIDRLCNALDQFGHMGEQFVLHNVLEWK